MSVQGHGQYTEDHTTQQQYQQQGGYPAAQRTQGYEQHQQHQGRGRSFGTGSHRPSKPFFMTSEFLVLLATIAAIVIAAAVVEDFDAARAWTLVTILSAAYIISRGLSKIGNHRPDGSGFNNSNN